MSFFTSTNVHHPLSDIVLLMIRLFVGFAMLSHGFPKLEQLMSGEEVQFYNFLNLGDKFSLILAVFSEFVCSMFIILGLFTRGALIFTIITMAVAAFLVHGADGFDKRELSLLYLVSYLLLFAFGPGRFSVDAMLNRKRERAAW